MIIHFNYTLFIQAILFGAFFWILRVLFYQPMSRVFRQRAARIEAGLRAAEESQRRAEETQREVQRQLDQARAEAQGIIAAATREAGEQRQELLGRARAEAEALVGQAQQEIQGERQAAVDELRRAASQLAILAASRAVGSPLDSAANRQLAEQAIAEAGVGPAAGATGMG